jgi:hypothetical protein
MVDRKSDLSIAATADKKEVGEMTTRLRASRPDRVLGALRPVLLLGVMSCEAAGERSPWPIPQPPQIIVEPIDWQESAAVFIGVEKFAAGFAWDVEYAADDATDLAYLFTRELERLPADRAVLLLAGIPAKASSREHLRELARAGATIELEGDPGSSRELGLAPHPVGTVVNQANVLSRIEQQARRVGENGILILSFATHGYSRDGRELLLTAESTESQPAGVVVDALLQATQSEKAISRLLLLDACRVPGEQGITAMPSVFTRDQDGYYILFAAAPGHPAGPDSESRNGIFTGAVLDTLRCPPDSDDRVVKLSDLANPVDEKVMLRSGEKQRVDFQGGGIGGLQLVHCRAQQPIGVVLAPSEEDIVVRPSGVVEIEVSKAAPELFATVLACAESNGVCYHQNPNAPTLAPPGTPTRISVQYGREDRFKIYVVLSADREFLQGEETFPSFPFDRRANSTVYRLGPIGVTFTTRPVVRSPRNGVRIGDYRIEAEGSVPEERTPFFAVAPVMASPRVWIQPPIYQVEPDGSCSGLVYLGEPVAGAGEPFKIYLLACRNAAQYRDGDQLSGLPAPEEGCLVSDPVTVHREL